MPYTMNHYSYCFNRPMDLVDLNGMWPKWVETTVKAVTVVTTVVAVGAVVVGTGGTAAPFIAGVLLAGTIGGFANENIGGSYSNGFLGGCFTGIIQGAYLSCEGPDSVEDLKSMEAQGVEVMTCGTCLNHYGLTEKLAVGSVTNMYVIAQTMMEADHIVKP